MAFVQEAADGDSEGHDASLAMMPTLLAPPRNGKRARDSANPSTWSTSRANWLGSSALAYCE